MTFKYFLFTFFFRRAAVYIPSQRDEYIRRAGHSDEDEEKSYINEVEMVTLDDSGSDHYEQDDDDDAVTIIGQISNRNQYKSLMTRDPEQQQDEAMDNFELEVRELIVLTLTYL